jgi:predicted outer membrane repeat protein
MEQYHFKNNSAQYGGVFRINTTNLILVGNNDHTVPIVFENNIATSSGAVIKAHDRTTSNGTFIFHNNMAIDSGGVLYGADSVLELTHCQFLNNRAGGRGGGIILFRSIMYLRTWNDSHQSPSTIQNNHSNFLFQNNMAIKAGGAIYVIDCTITMQNSHFIGNEALSGGAMAMYNSTVTLNNSNNSKYPMEFHNNKAQVVCQSFSTVV